MILDFSPQFDVVQNQPGEARVPHIDRHGHLNRRFADVAECGIHNGHGAWNCPVPIIIQPEADFSVIDRDALPRPAPVPDHLNGGITPVKGQTSRTELLGTTVWR